MKIGICLYGLHPKYCWKGKSIRKDYSYIYWKKNVFDVNKDLDIFIHSWSVNDKKQIIEEYKPKLYIIEKQKKFNIKNIPSKTEEHILRKYYNMGWEEIQYSSTYSMKKSIELLTEYEKKNNIKYDYVMLARMDLLWLVSLNFSELDKNTFYVPIWGDDNKYSLENNKSNVLGNWFISNSDNMKKFGMLYDNLGYYIKDKFNSMHTVFKLHIDSITHTLEYKFSDSECDKQRDIYNNIFKNN